MKLSQFNRAFIVDKKLKMNYFEAGLNPNLKEKMLVCQYISYEDIYYTVVNMEKAIKQKSSSIMSSEGIKAREMTSKKIPLCESIQEASGGLSQ